MSPKEEEDESQKTTRIGSLIVAGVYCVTLGALVVGGAILNLIEKRKGRGNGR